MKLQRFMCCNKLNSKVRSGRTKSNCIDLRQFKSEQIETK